jgi:hypothetical protein
MAGSFPDCDYRPHGHFKSVYPLADFLCEMGYPIVDLRRCSFALQLISDQYDLVLLSAEGKDEWHLSSK